jgi:hypothetical protein
MLLDLCHEVILGSGGIAPRIIDLGTIWRWVASFTPQPLYPQGKSPWYPLDRRLGGSQRRSGRGVEEENSEPLPGLEPPIIQPISSFRLGAWATGVRTREIIPGGRHWWTYSYITVAKFEVFTTVKIQIAIFLVVTPCSVAVGYRRFGGVCCIVSLHI